MFPSVIPTKAGIQSRLVGRPPKTDWTPDVRSGVTIETRVMNNMANYLQTKAIVLGHRDLAEHDRLYTLYTEAKGKIEVRVRGARKILSKLQPPLSSIAVVRVLVYEGRSRPLLIGIETAERLPQVAATLWRSQVAARFIRLVDLATRPEIHDAELFALLRDGIHMAEHVAPTQAGALRDAFILQLLIHSGYKPELDRCVQCRNMNPNAFSAAHGGAICAKCAVTDPNAIAVCVADFDALRAHATVPLAATAILPASNLGAITQSLLRYRLETLMWFPAI
jgi:DNA repair protein RecO (recombination protein O)